MKLKFLVFSLVIVAFSGCITARLYPIQGPLSTQVPLPILEAKVSGVMGNSGKISVVLPDGENCSGRWSSMAPTQFSYSAGSANATATTGMSSVWATVYGSGFSISNAPGVNKGEAMIVGNKGTVIQVEFYTGSGTASGSGVAKDNKGNIYKLIF